MAACPLTWSEAAERCDFFLETLLLNTTKNYEYKHLTRKCRTKCSEKMTRIFSSIKSSIKVSVYKISKVVLDRIQTCEFIGYKYFMRVCRCNELTVLTFPIGQNAMLVIRDRLTSSNVISFTINEKNIIEILKSKDFLTASD